MLLQRKNNHLISQEQQSRTPMFDANIVCIHIVIVCFGILLCIQRIDFHDGAFGEQTCNPRIIYSMKIKQPMERNVGDQVASHDEDVGSGYLFTQLT